MSDKPDAEFLHVAVPEEFLPPISCWATVGGLALLGVFGTAVLLSSVLMYRVTIKAHATVRPAGELRIVQAATEGTVNSIDIRANQEVAEGDIIAHIDASRLQTKINQLQGNIQQANRQLYQIEAQLRAVDRQIAAETDLLQRTLASAQAELSLSQRTYRDQLITTSAEVQEVKAALAFARDELMRYRQLASRGLTSQIQLKGKEAAMKAAEARLQRAEAALNPSAASVAMVKEKITQAQARGEAASARLRQQREQLVQQRVEIQNQLSSAKDEHQQMVTEIAHAVIRAPTAGTIQELLLRNKGQVVQAGDVIARIAPRTSPLELKLQVAARDIGKVKIGQTAHIRISACPYPDYGTLKGTVRTISPDAMGQHNTLPANPTFDVTVQPDSLTLRVLERSCTIQAGMEGNADITSNKEAVLHFFLRKVRMLTDL